MARLCKVCTHPQRQEIDRAILAATASKSGIARNYDVPVDSVDYHAKAGHISKVLAQSAAAAVRARADDLAAEAEAKLADAQMVLDWAKRHVNLGPKYGGLVLRAIERWMAVSKDLLAAAQARQAIESAKASVTAPDVRASLDRKLDALAERIKKVRGPQETLAEFVAADRAGRIQQVRAKAPKCPHCGQALPPGEQGKPAVHEGPEPTGPVH
jgi:DNA repair exonuclease SbcCD ATPase subunit